MVCVPAASDEVEQLAVALVAVPVMACVQITVLVVESVIVIVPANVVLPPDTEVETVALKVTDWFTVELGVGDETLTDVGL